MKTKISQLILTLLLAVVPALTVLADDPDGPPNPGGDPGAGGGQPVGAPVDGGLTTLLVLGAAYGGYKLYKKNQEEDCCE